jgi:hypothetical protein
VQHIWYTRANPGSHGRSAVLIGKRKPKDWNPSAPSDSVRRPNIINFRVVDHGNSRFTAQVSDGSLTAGSGARRRALTIARSGERMATRTPSWRSLSCSLDQLSLAEAKQRPWTFGSSRRRDHKTQKRRHKTLISR